MKTAPEAAFRTVLAAALASASLCVPSTPASEFSAQTAEAGSQATGYTIDDVAFEWSEQHPGDNPTYTGGDCTLDNLSGFTCVANTCGGGSPRDGLFCSIVEDCRDVIVEGACSAGACTQGRTGLACAADNDCDLGRCVAGNTELGCGTDADCNLATDECDAIPFRVTPDGGSGSSIAGACAALGLEKLFLYDCADSARVRLQDDTPSLCGPSTDLDHDGKPDGCSASERQVVVNARGADQPLGVSVILTEESPGSGLFVGAVALSNVQQREGLLFVRGGSPEGSRITVSYEDPECDGDGDGKLGESRFTDVDGDGVPNFGADGQAGDQDLTLVYVTGGPVSDDDNCFEPGTYTDVYNPPGTAQMDLNGDGLIDAADCVIDPAHNKTGQCDFDSDGVGDICDNCPVTPNAGQADADADGRGDACEDLDIDHDGVDDVDDNCPSIYNPSQSVKPGGPGGGSTRGELCDRNQDRDGDGIDEALDNCPNELSVEGCADPGDPDCTSPPLVPGPCPGGATECTYNPDQRDTDGDGIGDVCDDDDADGDGVFDAFDSCTHVYNPADPVFLIQSDSDGDGRGDDRTGRDAVGRCVGGTSPGVFCMPIGSQASCGAGGVCVQSADAYCDPAAADDNGDGMPDDLVEYTSEIDCGYSPGSFGGPSAEVADVELKGYVVQDDGTADYICVAGDPDPITAAGTVKDCPVADAGPAGDASCDTPGGGGGDGDCEPVPDGIMDPGEMVSLDLILANNSVAPDGAPRDLADAVVGLRSHSPGTACVVKGDVYVGSFPAGAPHTITTPAGTLQVLLDPATGQSLPGSFRKVSFGVTLTADGIQGTAEEPTFTLEGDADVLLSPWIPAACGTPSSGSTLGPNHAVVGALCEDFDTDRNGSGAFEFTRLYPAASPTDPLAGIPDLTDDVLGHTVDGGPTPFGVDGQICSTDALYAAARLTCYPVPTENDWHIHSPYEGCDPSYDPPGTFASTCAPGGGKAHSGFRSLHLGRHLNATDTLYDTYRFRQTSAFVMDPVNLGPSSALEFWHIVSFCDDRCIGAGAGATTAGGQVQLSLLDENTGMFEPWQRVTAATNGYNAYDQETIVLCDFDPGDDQRPPTDETMCGAQPQWSDIGDIYGTDRTCQQDTDGNDPVNNDCGETTTRVVDVSCSWIADPSCASTLENGAIGNGVWARSTFDLSPYTGKQVRLRWIVQAGGGWSFGESRSFLEPVTGSPFFGYDQDDGWYVDDIRLTDLRTAPAVRVPDPSDGESHCPVAGDEANCGVITPVLAGSAVDAASGIAVIFSDVPGAPVLLDARQTTAGDDPATLGTVEGGCSGGALEYQWSRLTGYGGSMAAALAAFSPAPTVTVAPDRDTFYRLEARCSSDPGCAASRDVEVLVYSGDGGDLATSTNAFAALGVVDGLFIRHDPVTDTATLRWRARPQPDGISGYDVFRAIRSVGPIAPILDIQPPSIESNLGPIGQEMQALTVTNQGSADLGFSIAVDFGAEPPFLSLDVNSGLLGPLGVLNVTVSIDASGLPMGVHTATIRFTSNDPLNPQVDVPVTLAVLPAPVIDVQPASLSAVVLEGAQENMTLNVGNPGGSDLHFTLSVTGSPQILTLMPSSGTAPPSGVVPITVSFDADSLAVGSYAGQINVSSDDPAHTLVIVPAFLQVVPPPDIDFAPATLYASLPSGGQEIQTLTVGNAGGADLHFTVSVDPLGDPQFVSVVPASGVVAPASEADLDVNFDAAGLGTGLYENEILIASDDPDEPVVTAHVSLGVGPPVVDVQPASISITLAQDRQGSKSLTIANAGGSDLTFSLSIQYLSGSGFLTPAPASGVVSPPLGSTQITLGFDATGLAPGTYSAEIDVSSNDPATPHVTIPVTFDVVVPPRVDVQPASFTSSLPQGGTEIQTLTISNNGGADLSYDLAPMFGGGAAFLGVDPSSGTVLPSGSAVVNVTFDASIYSPGIYNATIEVSTDDPDTPVIEIPVTLTISTAPDILVDLGLNLAQLDSVKDFTTTGAYTLHDLSPAPPPTGGGSFTITVEGDFGDSSHNALVIVEGQFIGSVNGTGGGCTTATKVIPVGQPSLDSWTFDGIIHVRVENAATVMANCPVNRHSVHISYQIAQEGDLDFGDVGVGTGEPLSLEVHNAGGSDLIVSGIASDLPEFVPAPTGFTLTPGASQTVTVTFTPTQIGGYSATLTIASNDPDEGSIQLGMLGNGVAASAGLREEAGLVTGLGGSDGASPGDGLLSRLGAPSATIEANEGAIQALFLGDAFLGAPFDPDGLGPATTSCDVPNGAPGTLVTFTDSVMPPPGAASFYMIGHSSLNGAALIPLGFRPSVSTRAGTLVHSFQPCP